MTRICIRGIPSSRPRYIFVFWRLAYQGIGNRWIFFARPFLFITSEYFLFWERLQDSCSTHTLSVGTICYFWVYKSAFGQASTSVEWCIGTSMV